MIQNGSIYLNNNIIEPFFYICSIQIKKSIDQELL